MGSDFGLFVAPHGVGHTAPSSEAFGPYRIEYVPFGNLEIGVALSPDGQFLGISEVKVKRDFLSPLQRVAASGFHDVEKFYQER